METEIQPTRVYYIDWLRVFAVLLLVPFHTAMIFVHWDFHIKNDIPSDVLTDFNAFLGMWHMPLLFFLSGVGSWFALRFRSGGQYVRERFLRLFVPLIFGIAVIIPPQVYCERLQQHQFKGSYLRFYPQAFNGVYPEGNLSWHHLWFLAYLFVFSLLALPLFLHFRSDQAQSTTERIATLFKRRGMLLLPALPLMLIEATLIVKWSGPQNFVTDWANFCFSITVFVFGFLLCAQASFSQAIAQQRRLCLLLGVGCVIFFKLLSVTGRDPVWGYNPACMAFLALRGFNTWCWVLAILGYGKTYLDFSNRFLRYATEAVLPFYILHQTVIVLIGFYVVQWKIPLAAKFLFINVTATAGTLFLYELAVRRLPPLRFLFGMKRARMRKHTLAETHRKPGS